MNRVVICRRGVPEYTKIQQKLKALKLKVYAEEVDGLCEFSADHGLRENDRYQLEKLIDALIYFFAE
jgi:hypothetical protein